MNDWLTNNRFFPQRAIIIYGKKGQWNSDYYLESREIKNKNGQFRFMTPVPLAANVLKNIAGSFIKKNSFEMGFGGIIASHLLYTLNKPGLTVVIWYRPEMRRSLNFSSSLKIKGSSDVQVPATLYAVVNNKLYVYALMNSDRPDYSTKLFKAPYFNIYEDGNVCLGSAPVGKIKAKTFDKEAERFERGFYMAEQNGGQSKQCKTDLDKLWPELIKKKLPFPSKKELQPHAKFKTLSDLIEKIIGNN